MQESETHNGEGLENVAVPFGPPIDSEEALFKRLFSTSPEQGFTYLFRLYHPVLCQYAFGFVHDQELARDLVADVFTHFWQHESYRKVEISYRAYLYRAVRFKAVSQ